MRFLLVLAGVLLWSCAPTGAAPAPSPGAAPAPTPADVTLRVGAAQNGESVAVAVGQSFAVELVGVPTAGYVWRVVQAPSFLSGVAEMSGPTSEAQTRPGFVGGNHWEVFVFRAVAIGEGEIVLEQRRPWESQEPAVDTFRISVVAR